MNQRKPRLFRGLAKASPETRKRVATLAIEARAKAFAMYREAKAKSRQGRSKGQSESRDPSQSKVKERPAQLVAVAGRINLKQ
jgi:hypothetical protein